MDGFRFLADGDCTAYIECNHNNAFAMRCSAGLLMDHRVFECLPSQQVNCQGRSETVDENKPMIPIFPDARPETTPNPPTNLRPGGPNQPPVIVERVPEVPRAPIISVPEIIATESPPSMSTCGSKPNDFRFAAKDDCSGYIECFRNAAYIRTCSPGLLFDHKTLKCLNHREVDCQGRAIPVNHNLPLRPVNPEIFPNRPVFPLDKPQVVETPISQPDLWRPPQNIPQIPHPDQFPSHPEMWWPPQQMPVMPPHQMPVWPPMGNHPEMWMPPQQMPVWPPMGNLPEMWMPPQNVPHGHFPTFPNWPAVNNQPPHQTPDFWMPPHNVPQQRPVDRPPTSNGQTSQMPAWPQQPSVRPQPNAGGNVCTNYSFSFNTSNR